MGHLRLHHPDPPTGAATAGQRAMRAAQMQGVSVADAATALNVHRNTVSLARQVLAHADPAVVAGVEAGRLTIYAADQIMRTVAREGQARAAQSVATLPKGKSRARVLGRPEPPKRRPQKSPAAVIDRCLMLIESASMTIEALTDQPLPADRLLDWASRLREASRPLRVFLHTIEDAHDQHSEAGPTAGAVEARMDSPAAVARGRPDSAGTEPQLV